MTASPPRYSPEETARRGQEIYARDIQPLWEATHQGQFAAIDIETGTFELDKDDYTATENLLAQQPSAQIWLARVGRTTAYQIGGPLRCAMPLGKKCRLRQCLTLASAVR